MRIRFQAPPRQVQTPSPPQPKRIPLALKGPRRNHRLPLPIHLLPLRRSPRPSPKKSAFRAFRRPRHLVNHGHQPPKFRRHTHPTTSTRTSRPWTLQAYHHHQQPVQWTLTTRRRPPVKTKTPRPLSLPPSTKPSAVLPTASRKTRYKSFAMNSPAPRSSTPNLTRWVSSSPRINHRHQPPIRKSPPRHRHPPLRTPG